MAGFKDVTLHGMLWLAGVDVVSRRGMEVWYQY